jgi:hypothetical protein
MGLGGSFVSGVIAFAVTAFSMYVPVLMKDVLSGGLGGGIVVQMPNFDAGLLLGLGILAGAFAFAQKMTEKTNIKLSGFYGIIRYVVGLYYTVVFLQMIGTIIVPTYNITIQTAYLFLATLIILGIVLNMLAYIVKIMVPKEFEKKTGTLK